MKESLPYKRKPCSNCPFRKDSLKGWLGECRAKEIINQDSFVCHKTVDYSKDENEPDLKRMQCAGHMILLDNDNAFVRLARTLNIEPKLKSKELIFNKVKDFINHQKN